jgi:plastocyanin
LKIYRLLGLLLSAAMLLSACGGAPAAEAPTAASASPTTAPAPTTAPTAAPAPTADVPTPTFDSVSDQEPTVGALAASGTLGWRDQILRNDAVIVSISELNAPESGQVYAAWLAGTDSSLSLGTLSAGSNGVATLNYVSPTNANLLGAYERVYITKGPETEATSEIKNVILTGGLPEKALVHVRHVLFSIGATPGKLGFALGLRQEADELLRHAQFLKDAFDAGDFRLVKVHAEHISNIIEGSEAHDVNGDGKIQNPGDGFGLLANGQQDGYIKGMIDHARLAAEASDATDAIKLHAGHVQIAGENTRVRVQDIHDRAEKIGAASGIADTQQDTLSILALAQQVIQGIDANQDEQIGPVPGEGGVLTAYQHAQLMAGIPLVSGGDPTAAPAPAQAAPAGQPPTINLDIEDNKFTPNKITVPVGATVIWTNKGQRPHTVTADDDSLDSGTLNNGGTFSQTFVQAGTFPFFCRFHGGKGGEGMAGAIVVADESAAAKLPPAGQPAAAQPTQAADHGHADGAEVAVAIGDNTFTPKEIEIPLGTTIVWTNSGQRKHTATADDSSFNSDALDSGGTFKQHFDKPGTYLYYCEFHGGPGGQGMAGVIKVSDGGAPVAAVPTAPPPPPTAPPAPTPAPPPPAALTISTKDFEFAPKEIRVKVGTTITWKNDGAAPHTATAVDKSFDTAIFQPGESKSATFKTAGTFLYYCQLHGTPDGQNGMVGTVIVE